MGSPAFYINKEDLAHIGRHLFFSVGGAVLASCVVLLNHVQIAPQYLFLVPLITTLLVAAERYLANRDTQDTTVVTNSTTTTTPTV
jgi:hypothetical protein